MRRFQIISDLIEARQEMTGRTILNREYVKIFEIANALCDNPIPPRPKWQWREPEPDTAADREREWANAGMIEMLR